MKTLLLGAKSAILLFLVFTAGITDPVVARLEATSIQGLFSAW
jgi:hypothetical protein